MMRFMMAGVALQLCALPALAQNVPATQSNPPASVSRDSSMAPMSGTATRSSQAPSSAAMGAVPGANSFTEAQARSRLEKNGYSQVSGLTKDKDGIWRGSAMKNGSSVQVTVDYKGNISMN